jgi:hypothetical protein
VSFQEIFIFYMFSHKNSFRTFSNSIHPRALIPEKKSLEYPLDFRCSNLSFSYICRFNFLPLHALCTHIKYRSKSDYWNGARALMLMLNQNYNAESDFINQFQYFIKEEIVFHLIWLPFSKIQKKLFIESVWRKRHEAENRLH